jgi:molecular chaperone GrpE
VYRQFLKALAHIGIEPFESIGKKLDPHYHDVVSQAPGVADTILHEVERGYALGDTIIRHAKVVVGDGSMPL